MEPFGSLYGAWTSPIGGLVSSLRGAFGEPLWSLDQSHREPGIEPQRIPLGAFMEPNQSHREPGIEPWRSLLGAFMEPRPVTQGAWYGASRAPPPSSHMLGPAAGISSPSRSIVAAMEPQRTLLGAFMEHQSHRGPGMELQRSLLGAFMEPRPVPQRAWHAASEEPVGSLYRA